MKKQFGRFYALYVLFAAVLFCIFPGMGGKAMAASITVRDAQQEDAYTDDSLLYGFAYPVDDAHRLTYTDNLFTGPVKVNYVGGNVKNFGLIYQRAAVKFNIPAIAGTINDAKLKIYVVDANNDPVVNLIATADNSWSQTNRKFPKYDPTQIINGYANSPVSANSWKVFDVTPYLRSLLNAGNSKVSFVFKGKEGGNAYFNFVSNLETAQTDNRPVLEINYIAAATPPAVTGPAFSSSTKPTWSWNSNGGNGSFRYKLDNKDFSSGAVTTSSLSYTPGVALKEGSHTLYVQESWGAAPVRWTASGSFTIVVDTVPPGAPKVTGAAQTNNPTPTWTWTGSGKGNGTYRLKLDNSGLKSGATIVTSTSYTPESALSEGSHTLYIQESDAAGNWSASGSYTTNIDLTPPKAPIVSGPALTNSLTPTWNWRSDGNGNGTFRYKLDNDDLTNNVTTTTATEYTPASVSGVGNHTLYVQERDTAGNWSASGSFTITIDTSPPTVKLSHNHGGSFVKADDTVTITAVFNKEMANNPTILINNNGITKTTMSNDSGDHKTWTYLWTASAGNGTAIISVTGNDLAGNTYGGDTNLRFTNDNIVPAGYSITVNQPIINNGNRKALSFNFANAEVGTAYHYTISSSGGGADVTGKGYVNNAAQAVSGIDVSGLKDGALTLKVTLTDAAGNTGNVATFTVNKDTNAPSGYSMTIGQPVINNDNRTALSFSFADAELGTTYKYNVSSNGGGAAVTGSGLVNSNLQTVSGIDVSGLKDGTLSLSFTLTDAAGNTGNVVKESVDKDTLPPTMISFTNDHQGNDVKAGDIVAITAVFNENMAATPTITITNGEVSSAPMTHRSGENQTWKYLWTVPDGNTGAVATVAGNDLAGNAYMDKNNLAFSIDNTVPSGYSVKIGQQNINDGNRTALSFDFTDAEIGTTYHYIISSSGGGLDVTGKGLVDSAKQTVAGIDVSGLKDGTLSLNFSLTDAAGNTGNSATATIDKDVVIPMITGLTHDHSNNDVKGKDEVIITAVFNKEMADTPTVNISNTNITGAAMSNESGDRRTWTYLWTVPAGNRTVVATVNGSDTAGNNYSGNNNLSFTIDNIVPRGYSIAIDQAAINNSNKKAMSFSFAGAEIGTTYNYTISSSGGRTAFSRNGTVDSATRAIAGIDVSGLKDGTLTLSFTLTDAAGNRGKTITATIVKDTVIPAGYIITAGQSMINSNNSAAFSFSFSGAEIGTTYNYTIISSGGGQALNNNGTVKSAAQTVSGIDVSGLKDGTLTLSFTLTDTAGNTGNIAKVTIGKDTTIPLLTNLTHNHTGNPVKAGDAVIITAVFNKDMADAPTISISNSSVLDAALSNLGGDHRTWTYLWMVPDGNMTVTATVAGNDPAGNAYAGNTSLSFTIDNIPPFGYSVTVPQNTINIANQTAFSFNFKGAEKGTTYKYTISSSGGGETISNTGAVNNPYQNMLGIDVGGLNDGTLTLSFTLTDAAGNVGGKAMATINKDTSAPKIATLTHNHASNLVKAGDLVEITAVFYKDMAYTPTISISNGGVTEAALNNDNGDRRTWTYHWTVPGGDATAVVTIAGSDLAGNVYTGNNSLTFMIDNTSPGGYSVAFNQTVINNTNKKTLSFGFKGAEPGTTCQYTISSSEGDSIVFGSCFIDSATQTVGAIDVSGLNDGILTLSAVLIDAVGNSGNIATATVNMDAIAPAGYTVTVNQASINKGNMKTLSFKLEGAEPGTTYNYIISGDSGGEAVKGNGPVNNVDQTVTGIDVSGLNDGILTLRVTLTDTVGNIGNTVTSSLKKDTTIPTVTRLSHNHSSTQVKSGDNVMITVVFNKEMADTPSISIKNGAVSGAAMVNDNGDHQTWTYLWKISSGDGPALITVAGKDMTENTYTGSDSLNFIIDNTAPNGYRVTLNQAFINNSNATSLSFKLAGAEPGTTYQYEISSDGGGTAVTGNGPVNSADLTVAGIDVGGLKDGTLTLRVTLTDTVGNIGNVVTTSVKKDTIVPTVTSLSQNHSISQVKSGDTDIITAVFSKEMANTPSIFIKNGEVSGAAMFNDNRDHKTWTYPWKVSNGDGPVIITVAGNDMAGNTYAGNDRLALSIDNTAPRGYSVIINQAAINNRNKLALSFSIIKGEPGTTYNYIISERDGGKVLTGKGLIGNMSQTVSGIDVSGLKDGILTLNVALTDAVGNVGNTVTTAIVKDTTVPAITRLTHNHSGDLVKAGDKVAVTAVFNKIMGVAPMINISNTDISGVAMSNENGDNRTWIYLWTVPDGNGTVVATITGSDKAGNSYTGSDNLIFNLDNIKPALINLSPANNALRVGITDNLVINFNENVMAGNGNVTIKKTSDNSVVEAMSVSGAGISWNGVATVTIHPSAPLSEATSYYVLIDPGTFLDLAGNGFAGISDGNAWRFTTLSTAPTITFMKPLEGSTVNISKANLSKGISVKVRIVAAGTGIDLNNILLQIDGGAWLNPTSQTVNSQGCTANYQLSGLQWERHQHVATVKVNSLTGVSTSKTINFEIRVNQEKQDVPAE